MALNLLFTPAAEADLAGIWRYTAETWSPVQADRYTDALFETAERLCAMPELARLRPGFTPPVRIHPTGPHLILYREAGEDLVVIRILGARQDWRRIYEALDG